MPEISSSHRFRFQGNTDPDSETLNAMADAFAAALTWPVHKAPIAWSRYPDVDPDEFTALLDWVDVTFDWPGLDEHAKARLRTGTMR